MEFHLEFTPKQLPEKIAHHHKLMLMGSCFTENIGDKLLAHKFAVLQNPHGILFNPVSVKNAIENYIQLKSVTPTDLFFLNESFHSWDHHSRFSSPSAEIAAAKINESNAAAHGYLKSADVLMITYGSAWIYELTEKAANARPAAVAANNHKAPADWFNRRLMTPVELQSNLNSLIGQLLAFNPKLRIVFTISPVRHLREGFVENNRSKAALIAAVHDAVEQHQSVYYFPAYELVIDDLRDYRFYAEDMVHPNYSATNYVWEKFVNACIDEPSRELMKTINEINAAKSHKPFNPASAAHAKFKAVNLEKVLELEKKYAYIDFEKEKAFFIASENGSCE